MREEHFYLGIAVVFVLGFFGTLGFAAWDAETNKPKTMTQHTITTMSFPYDVTCVQKGKRSFICERAE